jgi:hypothetical protein
MAGTRPATTENQIPAKENPDSALAKPGLFLVHDLLA